MLIFYGTKKISKKVLTNADPCGIIINVARTHGPEDADLAR
jgi:hypothetical protein